MSLSFWATVTKDYGPQAFGLICVLILYTTMFKPMLDSTRLDFQAHQRLLEAQRKIIDSMESSSRSNEITSATIDRASSTMERTVEKLNQTVEKLKELD